MGVIVYNGYQVWRELDALMAGRKVPNAGWEGAWNILSGSAQAAVAGCAIADGISGLAGAGEGAAEAEAASGDTCALCFPAATPVRTRRGVVPIEKIKVGDEVLSRDRKSGKLEYEKVTGLIKPHSSKLLEVRISGERYALRPTPEHPFFVRMNAGGGSWVRASQLLAGDSILTKKGTWTAITSIAPLTETETVYNFEVGRNHDFFVGATGLLVHNALCGTNAPGEITSRGSFREGTLEDVWDEAADGPNGGKLCPYCGEEVQVAPDDALPRDWDVNHVEPWSERTFPDNVTRQQVLDDYNDGVELSCPSCNR